MHWDFILRVLILPSSASTSTPTPTLAEVSLILGFIFPPTHQISSGTAQISSGTTNPNRKSILTPSWLYLTCIKVEYKLHISCTEILCCEFSPPDSTPFPGTGELWSNHFKQIITFVTGLIFFIFFKFVFLILWYSNSYIEAKKW